MCFDALTKAKIPNRNFGRGIIDQGSIIVHLGHPGVKRDAFHPKLRSSLCKTSALNIVKAWPCWWCGPCNAYNGNNKNTHQDDDDGIQAALRFQPRGLNSEATASDVCVNLSGHNATNERRTKVNLTLPCCTLKKRRPRNKNGHQSSSICPFKETNSSRAC